MTEHYLEVHVNVDPEDVELPALPDEVARRNYFRRGKLLMQKGGPAPDMFYTWRGTDTAEAERTTRALISELAGIGIKVLRYKLEVTLVDSRESDRWKLLNTNPEETQ